VNSPYCLASFSSLGFLTSLGLGRLGMRTRTRLSVTSIFSNSRRDSSKEVLTDFSSFGVPTSLIYRTRLRLYVR